MTGSMTIMVMVTMMMIGLLTSTNPSSNSLMNNVMKYTKKKNSHQEKFMKTSHNRTYNFSKINIFNDKNFLNEIKLMKVHDQGDNDDEQDEVQDSDKVDDSVHDQAGDQIDDHPEQARQHPVWRDLLNLNLNPPLPPVLGYTYIHNSKLQASLPFRILNCTQWTANRNKENNVNTNHRRALELLRYCLL